MLMKNLKSFSVLKSGSPTAGVFGFPADSSSAARERVAWGAGESCLGQALLFKSHPKYTRGKMKANAI